MLSRRLVLAGSLGLATPAWAQQGSFEAFVAGIRAEAPRHGIAVATVDRAFAGVKPNPKVIELDHHQPEFTFTWQQYKARLVSDSRVARGREFYRQNRTLLETVQERYGVSPAIIMGIWGLESDYGRATGGFNVIEALATLAWEGRRASYFRSELFDALRILDHGDIPAERMTGSYAGAMGQTQFMPDSFLAYAVDFNGNGRRDIWGDLGDVFASTANYLAREGWQHDIPWGDRIVVPPGLTPYEIGRDHRRPLAEWLSHGVRMANGAQPRGRAETQAAVILPGGAGDDAYFAYYPNFLAIRRYNPSDFYDICVGLIGDAVVA